MVVRPGKIKNIEGQSATEFLLLLPVLVYVVIVTFQFFSIFYTSMVNQAAAKFELFRRVDNQRGYSKKIVGVEGLDKPIYPELETFSDTHRASREGGRVDVRAEPTKPYFAVMVEEPKGSGSFPRRNLSTTGAKEIKIKTKYGICEFARGICR